jgi:general nucleoside transport system permease protein
VALATYTMTGWWILPLMVLAGMAGGALYGAVPALLKTRLNVNEILTSLMLTYASVQLIYYLVRAPWKDPMGMGFPQTRRFAADALLPNIIPQTIVHAGVPIAIIVALIAWFVMSRSVFGYQMKVVGAAPHAARYGGFSENKTIWLAFLVSGGLAGLAGALEVSGPFQRMVPGFPTNYGFTAIIVAFLGRLNPLGVIFAGIIMAITFVGGEVAQTTIGLSNSATGVFQAMMLFFLLAGDLLVRYRVRRVRPAEAVA